MSDIVKKGFFRRCLYRATGAYLLEQHIQMLEQQVKTQQMQLAQMEKEGEERKAQDAQQQQFNTTSQERQEILVNNLFTQYITGTVGSSGTARCRTGRASQQPRCPAAADCGTDK